MKKWVLLLLLCCFGLGCFSSCAKKEVKGWMEKNGKLKVLSTTAMIDDLVGQIGGEHIDHTSLIMGEMDPHSYELIKGDDEEIGSAEIIFCNGLGLEHGASLRYRLEKHPYVMALGEKIRKRFPEKILNIHQQCDPHIWMDISLWVGAIDPIVEALSQKDPHHAADYQKNGEALFKTMMRIHDLMKKQMAEIPLNKRYLVTSHDAFNYFTRAYLDESEGWQERCQAPEGLAPDGQLSSLDIQRIIDHLFAHHITVVFSESNVSRDALKKVVASCAQKGLPVKISTESLYCDAMGQEEAGTYLGMMQHNLSILIKEWENAKSE